jgi:phage terminase small subunit
MQNLCERFPERARSLTHGSRYTINYDIGEPNMTSATPSHLTDKGQELFSKLQQDYDIFDPDGVVLLTAAVECFDRVNECRGIIAKEGLTDLDRFGQSRPHPCVKIERDARAQMLASIRALNLGIETPVM